MGRGLPDAPGLAEDPRGHTPSDPPDERFPVASHRAYGPLVENAGGSANAVQEIADASFATFFTFLTPFGGRDYHSFVREGLVSELKARERRAGHREMVFSVVVGG